MKRMSAQRREKNHTDDSSYLNSIRAIAPKALSRPLPWGIFAFVVLIGVAYLGLHSGLSTSRQTLELNRGLEALTKEFNASASNSAALYELLSTSAQFASADNAIAIGETNTKLLQSIHHLHDFIGSWSVEYQNEATSYMPDLVNAVPFDGKENPQAAVPPQGTQNALSPLIRNRWVATEAAALKDPFSTPTDEQVIELAGVAVSTASTQHQLLPEITTTGQGLLFAHPYGCIVDNKAQSNEAASAPLGCRGAFMLFYSTEKLSRRLQNTLGSSPWAFTIQGSSENNELNILATNFSDPTSPPAANNGRGDLYARATLGQFAIELVARPRPAAHHAANNWLTLHQSYLFSLLAIAAVAYLISALIQAHIMVLTKSLQLERQKLSAKEQQLMTLSEGSPLSILIISRSNDCLYSNTAASELLGKPAASLAKRGWVESLAPDTKDEFLRRWETMSAERNEQNLRVALINADKKILDTTIKTIPLFYANSLIGHTLIIEDHTERRRLANELIRITEEAGLLRKNLKRETSELSAVRQALHEAKENIVYLTESLNKKEAKIDTPSQEELSSPSEPLCEELRGHIAKILNSAAQLEIQSLDREVNPLPLLGLAGTDGDGKPTLFGGVFNAISSYFNPRICQPRTPDRDRLIIEEIRLLAESALLIIEQQLSSSSPPLAARELQLTAVTPLFIASEIQRSLSTLATKKKISYGYEVIGEIPESIETDAEYLKEVLTTLARDALKHTAQGGVKMLLRMDPHLPQLCFEIIDTGSGITDTGLQGETTRPIPRRQMASGQGACIPVVARKVKAIRGSLTIESSRGRGTVVIVRIPTVFTTSAAATEESVISKPAAHAGFTIEN